MDDLRDVPTSDEQDSVNDEFAPVISPDPAIPPEKDPLAGQPLRDESNEAWPESRGGWNESTARDEQP